MMADPMIAALVREVLGEELARIKASKGNAAASASVKEEQVTISNDSDLQAFVRRILSMAAKPEERRDLMEGKVVFRLEAGPGGTRAMAPATGTHVAGGNTERFDSGLLSERIVDQLPMQTKTLLLGKQAHTTPLARDRLRQRGISIERMK